MAYWVPADGERGKEHELSSRTGKPKRKPRGKPFTKGSDERRPSGESEEQGQGQGSGGPPFQVMAMEAGNVALKECPELAQALEGCGLLGESFGKSTAQALELLKGGIGTVAVTCDQHGVTLDKLSRKVAVLQEQGSTPYLKVKVEVPDLPDVPEYEGLAHCIVPRVLKLAVSKYRSGKLQRRFNLLLSGPRGCGKSEVGNTVAQALGLDFYPIPIKDGDTEAVFFGRARYNIQEGTVEYEDTAFKKGWVNGGVLLIDEVDNGSPQTLNCLNYALDAGKFIGPCGNIFERHPNTVVIATANTWGNGASRDYCRNQLDAAFMDRFILLAVDYDTKLEGALLDGPHGETICKMAKEVRGRIEGVLRRELGTRKLIQLQGLLEAGIFATIGEGLRHLCADWTESDCKVAKLESYA